MYFFLYRWTLVFENQILLFLAKFLCPFDTSFFIRVISFFLLININSSYALCKFFIHATCLSISFNSSFYYLVYFFLLNLKINFRRHSWRRLRHVKILITAYFVNTFINVEFIIARIDEFLVFLKFFFFNNSFKFFIFLSIYALVRKNASSVV